MYIYYIGTFIFIFIASFMNFRVGSHNIGKTQSSICVLLFSIFTLYIYYSSVNAIDSVNYRTRFEYVDSIAISVDYFFTLFIKFIKSFTKNYQVFRVIIGCFYLFPILFIVLKDKNEFDIPLFLLLCLIFPFFQSIVSLRFTMASSIIELSLYLFLKSNQTKKDIMIVIINILISSMIHDTSIIYLLIFILFLISKKIKDKNIILLFIMILNFALIILLRSNMISSFVKSLVGETNAFYLVIMESARLGFIITILLHVAYVLFLHLIVKKKSFNYSFDSINFNDFKSLENKSMFNQFSNISRDIMLINICSLVLIPLYSINVLSFRLFRGLLLLNFFVISKYYYRNKKDLVLFGIIVLGIICMLFDANGLGSIISILGGGNI